MREPIKALPQQAEDPATRQEAVEPVMRGINEQHDSGLAFNFGGDRQKLEVNYRRVEHTDDPALEGFIEVYQTAFSGPPYFENYSRQDVELVWKRHIPHILIVAEVSNQVIGLGCAHPVLSDVEPSICDFLVSQRELINAPLEKITFMSELAVLPQFRGRGIGSKLITSRWEEAANQGYTDYIMRTAEIGSNSVRMYEKMNAQRLPFAQVLREEEIATASRTRIFMTGTTTRH